VAGIQKFAESSDAEKADPELAVSTALGAVSENLNLTAEQASKTVTLLAGKKQRKMAALEKSIKQVSKDPSGMMTLLLVCDAAARGEIDKPEFERQVSDARTSVGDPAELISSVMSDDENPLTDEEFVKDFRAMLSPEQQTALEDELKVMAAAAAPDASKADASPFQDEHLEAVDTGLSSLKKVIAGMKAITEGATELVKPK
jgi:hypothetical protein